MKTNFNKTMKKLEHKLLLAATALAIAFFIGEEVSTATTTFVDTEGHWAAPYISTAVNAGLMGGTTDTTFSPNDSMTLGQFAVIIVNGTFDGKTIVKSTDTHWADPYINVLLNNGLLKFSNGMNLYTFDSSTVLITEDSKNSQVSRNIAAVIISRLMDDSFVMGSSYSISHFMDVSSQAVSSTDIARMVEHEIMAGTSNTTFGLNDNITRGQICVIIENLLDKCILSNKKDSSNGSTGSNSNTTTTTPNTSTTTTPNPDASNNGSAGSSSNTTTTTPNTSTSERPTTAAGTAPVIGTGTMAFIYDKPDDAVAGSGQYNTALYTVPADTNKDGWITYREVAAVWEEIYVKYPHGMAWTNETHSYTSNVTWRKGKVGLGCAAFAFMCSDLIFGNLPVRTVTGDLSLSYEEQIRPGDVCYSSALTHWQITGGTAYLEGLDMSHACSSFSGNANGKVFYGTFAFYEPAVNNILSSASTGILLFTRYPEA